MIELKVKVSGEDKSFIEKFLIRQEGLCLSHDDAVMKQMVESVIAQFKGKVDDVLINIKFTW